MIQCQEKGLGTARKIPSLVVASSCIDNIIAIAGHSLIIGIIFNKGISIIIINLKLNYN